MYETRDEKEQEQFEAMRVHWRSKIEEAFAAGFNGETRVMLPSLTLEHGVDKIRWDLPFEYAVQQCVEDQKLIACVITLAGTSARDTEKFKAQGEFRELCIKTYCAWYLDDIVQAEWDNRDEDEHDHEI